MKKEARVLIVESDPFARSWIALLLARDWRTRVMGEVASLAEARVFLEAEKGRNINLVLLDAGLLARAAATTRQFRALIDLPGDPLVLLFGDAPDAAFVQQIPFDSFCGYLIKTEIGDGLAWAAACAEADCWAITPGMEPIILQRAPGAQLAILDGRKPGFRLTASEAEYARLAFLFSMERSEVADEKNITLGWGYSKISEIYEDLGLDELLSGETNPDERLGRAFTQLPRFQQIVKGAARSEKKKHQKNKELEALAFHILSMPEIQIVG